MAKNNAPPTTDVAAETTALPVPQERPAYYTVVKGPIKVRSMILGKGHKNLLLTSEQAAALGDNVRREMPTVK
jgi:hypothetical protein